VTTRERRTQVSAIAKHRRQILEDAGFGELDAHRLARDLRYDAQALIDLVRRGLPPTLAVKLVEPTVDEGSAA
jgi:hypothetical protein